MTCMSKPRIPLNYIFTARLCDLLQLSFVGGSVVVTASSSLPLRKVFVSNVLYMKQSSLTLVESFEISEIDGTCFWGALLVLPYFKSIFTMRHAYMQSKSKLKITLRIPLSFRRFEWMLYTHSDGGWLPACCGDDDDQEDDGHDNPDDRHHLHVLPPVLPLQAGGLLKRSRGDKDWFDDK